jgi:hypothetical protein
MNGADAPDVDSGCLGPALAELQPGEAEVIVIRVLRDTATVLGWWLHSIL